MLAGIDIGGTKTAVILAEDPTRILFREEFPTRPDLGPEQAIEKIESLIASALALHPGLGELRLGVSCGGPLDRHRGIIQSPPNLRRWVDVPIKQILEARFGAPCLVENDANAGAIAEHRYGAGSDCQNLIFLTMGTGFGAGLILDGELYRGSSEMAGEIGHVRLTEDGPVGYGKSGSVEGWASGWGMAQFGTEMVSTATANGESTSLANIAASGQLTARDIGMAAAQGDGMARRIVERTGVKLGHALAILVDVLNPERIVIGGLALRLGDMLFEPALAAMKNEALEQSARVCQVVPARLGERIGDVSALCVAQGLSRSAPTLRV
ncbi:ROK family protein [Occallatibacter riparius]|uniref:ROK family protein n=1 Tax=Occallatibacter riparius TaxID=1002689 RepID=A0A9J7BVT9_9BACT|nr:ROK family protein [Occallatibacter riparius]UWZ86815.1 ROK family protein [Occallatibacter riparius]